MLSRTQEHSKRCLGGHTAKSYIEDIQKAKILRAMPILSSLWEGRSGRGLSPCEMAGAATSSLFQRVLQTLELQDQATIIALHILHSTPYFQASVQESASPGGI